MALAYDSSGNSGYLTAQSQISKSIAVAATSKLVLASFHCTNGNLPTSVEFLGGRQFYLVKSVTNGSLTTQIWACSNPPTGLQSIRANGTNMNGTLCVASYTESANVGSHYSAQSTGTGNGLPVNTSITLLDQDWYFSAATTVDESITLGSGETVRQNLVTAGVGSHAIEDKGPLSGGTTTGKWNGINAGAYAIAVVSFGLIQSGNSGNVGNQIAIRVGI